MRRQTTTQHVSFVRLLPNHNLTDHLIVTYRASVSMALAGTQLTHHQPERRGTTNLVERMSSRLHWSHTCSIYCVTHVSATILGSKSLGLARLGKGALCLPAPAQGRVPGLLLGLRLESLWSASFCFRMRTLEKGCQVRHSRECLQHL